MATKMKTNVLDRIEGETDREWMVRLLADGTAPAVERMEGLAKSADDDATLTAWDNAVNVAWILGQTLTARATILNGGQRPAKAAEIMAKVGVTEKSGTYLAKGYKALGEAIKIATHDTDVRRAAFVAAWHEASGGQYPTQVRQYAAWCTNAASSGKAAGLASVTTLAKRRTAAETARANAVAKAAERKDRADAVKAAAALVTAPTAHPVAGLPVTLKQADAMSADSCEAAAIYFADLAKAKRDAVKAAAEAKRLADAAGETGPKAKSSRSAKSIS